MQSETCAFHLAIILKTHGPLSKTITLGADGNPVSDDSDCNMISGVARNVTFNGITGLAELISGMSSENALALGTIRDRADSDTVQITTKGRLSGIEGEIARTKDYFDFAEGEPGLLLIDFDQKGMPEEVRERLEEAGGVWEIICSILPNLAAAGHLCRASTSAGLRNAETGEEFGGSGGVHIYIAVQDASDIPRATRALHQRLWLGGLGWIWVGKIGQLLERSIVDQSVGSPERLVFEGAPVLVPPLEQSAEARRPIVVEGDVIDTRLAIPSLSPRETAGYEAKLQMHKNEWKPEADIRRAKEDDRLSAHLAEKAGISVEQASKQIARRHFGELLPLHPLQFDDPSLGEVTVGDVLLEPIRFVERTLADPLEGISYGCNKAKVFRRRDGSLWINSFAHGGMIYNLKHNGESLRNIIGTMDGNSDVEGFITAIADAVLEPGDEKGLLHAAKLKTGVNVGELRSMLDSARRARTGHTRQRASGNGENDGRVRLRAPAGNEELTPVLTRIDEVLASVNADTPTFRTLDHRLARVARHPLSKLHQLVSEGELCVAPPEQTTIKVAEDAEATMIIEEHVCFVVDVHEDGNETRIRLQLPFVRAYSSWENSALPRVSGIATLPFVLSGGELKSGRGLDRELGLIFDVDPSLQKALGDGEPASINDAKTAYDWLRRNWLIDVDTDEIGMAIIIALALTMIERHLLVEFPAFFVTAAQRGSGKTTVLNMVSTALTGSVASAASWSFDDEERRKAIFSFLREGAPLVVYDNIPRGSALSCPTIERVLTSAELSDRVLGESRSETVPASTVIAFTGNNVGPKGDMASRSLVADLATDRPDPENRKFKHDDPIEWTKAHRFEVLSHLFTILLLERDKPNRAKTRFKTWWLLIGHPLELVSGMDFEKMFLNNDMFDEEAQGAAEFISMMLKYLGTDQEGTREFSAAEITELVDDHMYGFGKSTANPNKPDTITLKSALEEASGRPFSGGQVNVRRVAKKLLSIEKRPVDVDGKLYNLVVFRDHEGNRYRIVPLL